MASSTPNAQPRGAEPPRMAGIDVARALAVFGMVLVNYEAYLDSSDQGPSWLVWLSGRLEGRAGALFVVIAGIGISLRSRHARQGTTAARQLERRALLKRAGILFVLGMLLVHLWAWDILHCYGAYLALAALFLFARPATLWLGALGAVAGTMVLQLLFPYADVQDLWSGWGLVADLGYNGLFPVFPWMAFLLVGMWLGRQDLRDGRVRRRLLGAALLSATLAEAVASAARNGLGATLGLSARAAGMLSGWPRPPTPVYVLAAGGTAVALLCAVLGLTERYGAGRWVVWLAATGQLAFTLYVAHVLAVVVPYEHGLLEGAPLAEAMGYGVLFYAVAVVGSVWWRRRWARGPLEGLIAQVTGRAAHVPWGGVPLGPPRGG